MCIHLNEQIDQAITVTTMCNQRQVGCFSGLVYLKKKKKMNKLA